MQDLEAREKTWYQKVLVSVRLSDDYTPEALKHCPFLSEAKPLSVNGHWVSRLHQIKVWIQRPPLKFTVAFATVFCLINNHLPILLCTVCQCFAASAFLCLLFLCFQLIVFQITVDKLQVGLKDLLLWQREGVVWTLAW